MKLPRIFIAFTGIILLWIAVAIAGCAILVSRARAAEYAIPSTRLPYAGAWTPNTQNGVGVIGGIPTRTELVDITQAPYFADNTGVADVQPIFYAAYDAVKNYTSKVLYLPAGTYRFNNAFTSGAFYGFFTIRGAGPSTILKFYNQTTPGGQAFMVLGNGSDYAWFNGQQSGGGPQVITGGLTKGSNTLTVADASVFQPNDLAQIMYDEGTDPAHPVVSVLGFRYANNQGMRRNMVTILSKSGNTLTIAPKIYGDPPNTGAAKIMRAYAVNNYIGLEDMTIDISNSNTQEAVQFSQTRSSWMKNVVVKGAVNYQVAVFDSVNFEMRGCTLDGGGRLGTNGAGILMGTACSCLIEDNIMKYSQPVIEANFGSSGNVFGYNFIKGASHSMDGNHGPHNEYNLYEGNVAAQFESDGYYGGSEYDTVFRNYLHGQFTNSSEVTVYGAVLALKRFARSTNFIGNTCQTLGYGGYTDRSEGIGQPNIGNGDYGNPTVSLIGGTPWPEWATRYSAPVGATFWQAHDADVEGTILRKANHYVYGNTLDSALTGGDTLADSLYRSAKPSFFGALAWPPFDPTAVTPVRSFVAIPAGYRYVNDAPLPGTVEPPTFSPDTGSYIGTQSMALASATSAASIYYTINGTTPTTGSTLYTAPFSIATTTTVKAFAVKSGMTDSGVNTAVVTIVSSQVATPTAAASGTGSSNPRTVTFTCATASVTMRYTLDGSTPTNVSTLYTGPFTITADTSVTILATKSGLTDSALGTASFTVGSSTPTHIPTYPMIRGTRILK